MSTFAYHPDRPGIVCIAGDLQLHRDTVWGYTIPDADAPLTHRVAQAIEAMPTELVRRFLQDVQAHLTERTSVPEDLYHVDPAAIPHWLPILKELHITTDAPYPLGSLRYDLEVVNGPEYPALRDLYARLRDIFPIGMVEVCRSVASFRNFRTLVCDMAGDNAEKVEALMLLGRELARLSAQDLALVGSSMLAAGVAEDAAQKCIARLHPVSEEALELLQTETTTQKAA